MTKEIFQLIEQYMLSCMTDSAHDRDHVYRVLYTALEIAREEKSVDMEVLCCACLLHDIGRQEQFRNSSLDHASVGADKAKRFLLAQKFPEDFAQRVHDCIFTHRFRSDRPPQSIEAKILFDADKLDVSGAVGIARTLLYNGEEGEPLYSLLPNGCVSTGENDKLPSFFQEYKRKLEGIYSRFYTKRGKELALSRQKAAVDFYENLLHEVSGVYCMGRSATAELLREESGTSNKTCLESRKGGNKEMSSISIIRLQDRPELKDSLARWFHEKWGVPLEAYQESMEDCLAARSAVPQWIAALEGDRIVGGLGVIENDFHNRKDLTPNVCAVFVEEDKRCQGIAGEMLRFICRDMYARGVGTLYLLTDHTSFYERYGWTYFCMVQGDGEDSLSRMYRHVETEFPEKAVSSILK